MAEANFHLPNPLNLTEGNLSEQYKRWKRQVEVYMEASGATTKPPKTQAAIILHCAGHQALEVFDHLVFDNDTDRDRPEVVFQSLEKYCNPRTNEVLQTYRFWNTPLSEPFDSFLTELRSRADLCNFKEKDRMLRDKIVFTVHKRLQEKLLRDNELTVEKAISVCRAYEQANNDLKEMHKSESKIEKVSGRPYRRQNNPQQNTTYQSDCRFCGKKHPFEKEKCPAWGKTCSKCKGRNHFAIKCRKVHAVVEEHSSDDGNDEQDDPWFALAAVTTGRPYATATLRINGQNVRFQLDTAADVNTICQKHVKKTQVTSSKQRLVMWNGTKVTPLGEATLDVFNEKTGKSHKVKFTVVENSLTCLMGFTTVKDLGFITINTEQFIFSMSSQKEKDVPEREETADTNTQKKALQSKLKTPKTDDEPDKPGELGTTKLHVDPDAKPKILPCRKVPFALTEKVKQELDALVKRGILIPVGEPTPWVSQMAIVEKASGALRLCLDPRPLNEALQREHFKLPTFEDVLPAFNKAKIFSKQDIKEAFWHIKLDEESSRLTTMITPYGRFRWTRLPFGLNVSSEIFQRHLSQALEGLEGCINVADDIIIAGRGETQEEAEKDHEHNLKKLKERCQDKGIKLNPNKASEKQQEVIFMGHSISAKGVQPDVQKIEAILKMPSPQDIHQVRRFCGMVQYLAKFLNNVSEVLQPLRALTKKDTPFQWSGQCEEAFRRVKEMITRAPVLAFYDSNKPLSLQVDSSKDGLGAVLLQEGKPIEFASRALTETEQRWAQIEKEMLAIVFGLERFDQYTYGQKVLVISDHKPLETIIKKPLSQAPRRLQNLLMRGARYHFQIQWASGKSLVIADTLSRAFIKSVERESERETEFDAPQGLPSIPDATMNKIRTETQKDPVLQMLIKTIREGWPQNKQNLAQELTPFFELRDTLSLDDNIILKGERILIPESLRKETKQKLHAAHLGYDSMMRRVRRTIYWPGINAEIKTMANTCQSCQETKPRNCKLPLIQHNKGTSPWEKVATDLFEIQGRHYMVTVDYFSNFIEVDRLTSLSTTQVIKKLKGHLARYGVPKMIVTDSGTQFSSGEFKTFTERWGIHHIMSAPGHHQANGKAESAVKIIKQMMKKSSVDKEDQYEALLELRSTPRQGGLLSPAQLVFGREIRTLLPCSAAKKVPEGNSKTFNAKLAKREAAISQSFNRGTRQLPELQSSQPVFYQNPEKPGWKPGQILKKSGRRSYEVQGENGGTYIRDRVHLRSKKTPFRADLDADDEPLWDMDESPTEPHLEESSTEMPLGTVPETASSPPRQVHMPQARPTRDRKPPRWMKDFVKH